MKRKKLIDRFRKYVSARSALLFICFFFPLVSIRMAREYEWVGRFIALIVAFGFGMPVFLWILINPKTQLITKGAKLSQPRFKKVKVRVELLFRLVLLLGWIFLLFDTTIPLGIGTYSVICGDKPFVISGHVQYVITPFPLLEFLSQEIKVDVSGVKSTYRFWYSFRARLRRNSHYEFLVLPRSKLILEARELKQEDMNNQD